MQHEELDILLSPQSAAAIERHIESDPLRVALDKSIANAALIATQIKYLQRAKEKLPAYYAARCIIPHLAFEQSSSQSCARRKKVGREGRVLDLTAGLGVDTTAFAATAQEVVAVERDKVLARILRENLDRLGVDNVRVVNSSAEEYLTRCDEHFDWVYADPDRRSARGEKMVRLEDCSPNILALLPHISRIGARLCLKCSPLFDVDEAMRLFPDASVEVVSLGGECKEVLIYTGDDATTRRATVCDSGEFSTPRSATLLPPTSEDFCPEAYSHLVVPDVALQKSRLAVDYLRQRGIDIWSPNGYGFATQMPTESLLAKVYEIRSIAPYNPKELKKQFKGCGAEILKRDFPLSTKQISQQTKLSEGGCLRIAFTQIDKKLWSISLGQKLR